MRTAFWRGWVGGVTVAVACAALSGWTQGAGWTWGIPAALAVGVWGAWRSGR
ncbi:MAG: hypothetical protein K6V97_04090 [Actinomycetia bacterium]|nr:hypothetical protein [Actinomycetes bacterium]